ncbi:MAG: hypothetical protein LBR32_06480, partial [Propionibacteriaceae bacterium]|nr:hypothetical protein [Propionibacteriaceae bacterium]
AGPGIDRSLIPPELGAVWVSHDGDLVETCLWADSADYPPGTATALVLRGGEAFALRLVGAGAVAGATRSAATKASPPRLDAKRAARPSSATPTGGSYLYEPDPAVIRAGGIDQLAERLGATRVNPGIAYLVGPDLVQTPFAEAFAVLDAWPYSLKALRAWTRAHEVGVLEIKCRGVDVDPAQLRRQLKLRGPAQAGVVLGPTPRGATAFVVRRVFGGRMTP